MAILFLITPQQTVLEDTSDRGTSWLILDLVLVLVVKSCDKITTKTTGEVKVRMYVPIRYML